MALTNPYSITYGSRKVGGTDDTYLLDGVYAFEYSPESLRLVFRVTLTADTHGNLKSAAETVEDDFSARDQSLTIDMGGSTFVYTNGTDILNSRASISKPGDEATDRGFSRSYIVTVEADRPADDQSGRREVSVQVDQEPGGQKVVTMQGVYTATSGTNAYAQFVSNFGTGASGESQTLLNFIDSGATFEMVDQTHTLDRNKSGGATFPHIINFTQQYVELLYNQSSGTLDNSSIADHTVTFSNLLQHAGASQEGIRGFRRVVATFDCAIVLAQSTNLQTLYSGTIRPFLKNQFSSVFTPRVFAVEDERESFDETTKRLSVQMQFIYSPSSGGDVVSVQHSVGFDETRTVDPTFVHSGGEFDAYLDPGWSVRRRISTRTVEVIGVEKPYTRIGAEPEPGPAGPIDGPTAGADVPEQGWVITKNLSSAAPSFIGNPSDGLIRTTILTETVVEQWFQAPQRGTSAGGGRSTGGFQKRNGPITGNRGGSYGKRFDGK